MNSIVTLGAVSVGINLNTSRSELHELGIDAGSYSILPIEEIEKLRLVLESKRGTLTLPQPNSGGSISNTATLLARVNLTCFMISIGRNNSFSRTFVSNYEKASLKLLQTRT